MSHRPLLRSSDLLCFTAIAHACVVGVGTETSTLGSILQLVLFASGVFFPALDARSRIATIPKSKDQKIAGLTFWSPRSLCNDRFSILHKYK